MQHLLEGSLKAQNIKIWTFFRNLFVDTLHVKQRVCYFFVTRFFILLSLLSSLQEKNKRKW